MSKPQITKRFLGIQFWNSTAQELLREADAQGGLFTVPSAPSLAQMRRDALLMEAYKASDWSVVDGGYVALVLRIIFGVNLPRISGLQLLQRLVGEKSKRSIPFDERKVLWVVPSTVEKERIDYFLADNGFDRKLRDWYLAPFYNKDEDFNDEKLLKKVQETRPDWVVLCIAGGKQEKLAYFLRRQFATEAGLAASQSTRPKGPVLLCTGGAIAFLTGGQVSIPTWADRLYLGWFFRVCEAPQVFIPRYIHASYQFPCLLWENRASLFNDRDT